MLAIVQAPRDSLLTASLARVTTSPFRVPPGLPTHFAFGLAADPDQAGIYGWMPASESGKKSDIRWDYAYQYLSGGVDTNGSGGDTGWETWNSDGQFPLYYAKGAASAAPHPYIPVFTYYELLQSGPPCSGDCPPASEVDLNHLNDPTLMEAYFKNFTELMQRLGPHTYTVHGQKNTGFGKTAIVHIEPDLSGYVEQAVNGMSHCYGHCTHTGNDPAYLRAAVASSGDSDVSRFANTYQGFNLALLHLRDEYAPNVLLAFHVSDWATGIDIGSDTSTTLNVQSLGQEAGSFAAQSGAVQQQSGVSAYNLIFNDVLDRDAGYYQTQYDLDVWWDRYNGTFPDFHRWEAYIKAVSEATEKPVMIWQVPEGNQWFDTEDNSLDSGDQDATGYFQDNRVEYFFQHISELINAGIIGVLFGAGNGGSTVANNANYKTTDYVPNFPSFCTPYGSDPAHPRICNNHKSKSTDGDGGYLRMEAQAYYAHPVALP
jgi:hypothetical protein